MTIGRCSSPPAAPGDAAIRCRAQGLGECRSCRLARGRRDDQHLVRRRRAGRPVRHSPTVGAMASGRIVETTSLSWPLRSCDASERPARRGYQACGRRVEQRGDTAGPQGRCLVAACGHGPSRNSRLRRQRAGSRRRLHEASKIDRRPKWKSREIHPHRRPRRQPQLRRLSLRPPLAPTRVPRRVLRRVDLRVAKVLTAEKVPNSWQAAEALHRRRDRAADPRRWNFGSIRARAARRLHHCHGLQPQAKLDGHRVERHGPRGECRRRQADARGLRSRYPRPAPASASRGHQP